MFKSRDQIEKEMQEVKCHRKLIRDTHDTVVANACQFSHLDSVVTKHIEDEEKTFKEIDTKIDGLSCPEGATIKLLKKHNEEQNGHLKDLTIQGNASTTKLDRLITEGLKITKQKDARRNHWIMVAALVSCMFVGVGICYTMMVDSKDEMMEGIKYELKNMNKQIKKNGDHG